MAKELYMFQCKEQKVYIDEYSKFQYTFSEGLQVQIIVCEFLL